MSEESADQVQWFEPTGRGTGLSMLVVWLAIAVLALAAHADLAVEAAVLICAGTTYVALLRPRVGTTAEDLVYRRMFSDLAIPLRTVEQVRVVRYFEAVVAGRRYISPAIARSRRRRSRDSDARDPFTIYADLVEDTTRARISEAKEHAAAHPAGAASAAGIRRTWAWPEIAAMSAAVVLFIVLAAI